MSHKHRNKETEEEEILQNEEVEKELEEEESEPQEQENENSEQEEEDESAKLAKEIEGLKAKIAEMNDTHLRLRAEYDNYRKRTLKEKAELIKSGGEGVLLRILSVVDDFERAISAMEKTEEINSVREGVNLIHQKFCDFLKQNGVLEIETIGHEFNTEFHEAITTIPAPAEEQKGKVIDCIQKGYTLNEKVIRFAKVVVGA